MLMEEVSDGRTYDGCLGGAHDGRLKGAHDGR